MELFYNPERMSETEIKETFVAHQWLVDEIVSILKRQPKGAGVQHVVIVAPRGMGKTTLLLMLRFAVLNTEMVKRWQPVLFPEESYSVYDLADLWVEFLNHIASETGDTALRDEVSELKLSHPDSDDLEAATLAKIKDWRKKNKKRLLMLLDNFDMILEQIDDEKDNASLRDVLMNDDTLMLVGGSTTFFKEARAYDQPLYNLFKIYNLNGLDSEQIEELLRRRAKLDGVENFEEILRANRTRLRVLEYFTGGNPRLVLMLYRVITHSQISDVRRGLEKLLDEVTPYYKAKIEALPPQQRKILDQIARITGQTREGLTPTEIAPATRLPVNHVSAQLKRLADLGYVRMANIRGRSSYYTLSEPLYAIWHQMRFSRETRKRMNWLIEFLRAWYDAKELSKECQRLQDVFQNYVTAGREVEARDALELRRYLMEAIEDHQPIVDLPRVRALNQVFIAVRDGKYREAVNIFKEVESQIPTDSDSLYFFRAATALIDNNIDECLSSLEILLKRSSNAALTWFLKGIGLLLNSKPEEAVDAFKRAIKINPQVHSWEVLADTLGQLDRHEEALVSYDEALRLQPNSFEALLGRCRSLVGLDRTEEALQCVDKIIELYPESSDAHYLRSMWLVPTNFAEALSSLRRAFDPKSICHRTIVNTLNARSLKTVFSSLAGDFDQVRLDWKELERYATDEDQAVWIKHASDVLTLVAKAGHWDLARELITSSNLGEQLFPLARALDYLLKGDETSIEKLSAEVRRIVDEIVSALKNTSADNGEPKRIIRSKKAPRKQK